jgi:hypothetical protein
LTEIESAGPAPSGPAVLDIGGGTGALLVIVPAALLHTEIEVSPDGRPDARTHTGVHERPMAGRPLAIALFPSLAAGTWTLWGSGPCATQRVEIADGKVTQLDLR